MAQEDSTCLMIGSAYTGKTTTGGLYVASKGVVKALAIFIKIQGDNSYSGSTAWPVNQPPTFLNTYLDSITSQSSIPWSISHYFRESSLDSLRIIGKGYSVTTQHTEAYYRDSIGLWDPTEAYGKAIKEVLQTLYSQINYSDYDNWPATGS